MAGGLLNGLRQGSIQLLVGSGPKLARHLYTGKKNVQKNRRPLNKCAYAFDSSIIVGRLSPPCLEEERNISLLPSRDADLSEAYEQEVYLAFYAAGA